MIFYPPLCRSRTSSSRIGILSMDRVNSRTSQGKGLRSFTSPSFPIRVNMKPRGLSFPRRADLSSGAVSVIKTTSLAASSPRRADSNSICRWNAGSAGLSAKMTTGRAIHLKASRSISEELKTILRSASQRATGSCTATVPSAENAAVLAANEQKRANFLNTLWYRLPQISRLNICRIGKKRRGDAHSGKIFGLPASAKERSR